MSYSILLSTDEKSIILEINEDITAQNIMKMIIEAHELGEKNKISRYLVDATRAKNISTATENYYFAYENVKTTPGINLNARVAMLVSPNDHSHDFIEIVTRNSGFVTKLFRDRDTAIKFLNEE